MKKLMLVFALATFLVLAALFLFYPNNSANRLRKDIGAIEELKIFSLPNDGDNPLVSTRNIDAIREFFDSVEFERVSPRRVTVIKMPGVLEFVAISSTATQRFDWVECGWGYLRTDNTLLLGDVPLTEASSKKLADWLAKQGIEPPERNPPAEFTKSKQKGMLLEN